MKQSKLGKDYYQKVQHEINEAHSGIHMLANEDLDCWNSTVFDNMIFQLIRAKEYMGIANAFEAMEEEQPNEIQKE